MLKLASCIMIGVLLTQPARSWDVTPTDAMCAEMLAEFRACFSGERTVEQLLDEWRWGDIRRAFAFGFDFLSDIPEKSAFCMLLGACPLSIETGGAYRFLKKEFIFTSGYPYVEEKADLLTGRWPLVRDLEQCYWGLGVKASRVSVRRKSLAFVYCSKRSAMYPLVHNHLGLKEPLYEEARLKHPSLFWDTVVHCETQFEPSHHNVHVVPWGALNAEVDVVYFFNRQTCRGVMLLNRESLPPKGNSRSASPSPDTATRDFSRFDEDFRWAPEHQVENVIKWNSGRPARIWESMKHRLDRDIERYRDNGDFIKQSGLRFLGTLRHPPHMHYSAPWVTCYYYELPGGDMTLQSVWGGSDWIERVHSFVVDVENLPEGTQVLLPYGLDIKPYLREYPTTGVQYEHIRADKRARIIVQPHIAYLYEDDHLTKILVCHDKNGTPDQGWSLARELYVCEETGYFWPVPRAYSPLGD